MNGIRPYIPLIGFVVPTVLVGYGIVIPRSCIAGLNELTIGFGTTILGAIVTYVAGQRAVAVAVVAQGQPRVCTKPPFAARIARAINRQAASPSGIFGRFLGAIWRREHALLSAEVLDGLDVCPGHRVLEVGCGPGHALQEAARRVRERGHVVGIDISELMVKLARSSNRSAVARGHVEVVTGDITTASLSTLFVDSTTTTTATPNHFDRIFSVHSIYFWRDLEGVLGKLAEALKREGRLVLAFRPEGPNIPERFRDTTYRFPQLEDLKDALERVGLTVERLATSISSPEVVIVHASRK